MSEEDKDKLMELYEEIVRINRRAVLILANPELTGCDEEFRVYDGHRSSDGGFIFGGIECYTSEAKWRVDDFIKRYCHVAKRKKPKNK